MLDNIYILFENGGKFFNSYEDAWRNHYSSRIKKVRYIFTPTMQYCKNVSELEHISKVYFNSAFGLDYIDVLKNSGYKQLKFIGEIN